MNHLILITSVFMLSTAPVIVKFLSMAPLLVLFWRLLFVSGMLLPFAWRDLAKITKTDVKMISISSIVLFIHFLTWFSGVPKLNIGVTAVVFASNPIFTAIIGFIVLGEPFKKRYLIAIAASILGIYITYFSGGTDSVSLVGIVEILAASFFYSTYMVYSKRNRASLSNGVYTFYLNLFTCILGLIALIAMIGMGQFQLAEVFTAVGDNWKVLFLLAFLPSILGHTLMIFSLPHYNLNFISCLKLLSPLSASVMAYFIFGEKVNDNLVIGFLLVSTGVLFALPWHKFKRPKASQTA
jgi:drug/metabolite transporter (DMT)-like permease